MNIYESLENLNISEECFNDIVSTIKDYINEYLVSDVKNATNSAIKTRMQKYKDTKSNSSSTPIDIKRASDRVDRAIKIKKLLNGKRFKDEHKANATVKRAIEKATKVISPEEKALKRQEEIQKMCYQMPSHNFPPSPSGFKYGKKPRAK